MAFSFAQAKRQVRQAVADTLGVPAILTVKATGETFQITARYHNRIVQQVNVQGVGADLFEDVDHVVFDEAVLAKAVGSNGTVGVNPVKNDRVYFVDYNLTLRLEILMPTTGPIEVKWRTTLP